ncbi:MAG: hypothetical protein KatS3mg111_0958 [Pirellulaceae bacterium]|nr:MAG: hypothetical protein KatS3mg111_0958 [Pirellulaceae bacterium]
MIAASGSTSDAQALWRNSGEVEQGQTAFRDGATALPAEALVAEALATHPKIRAARQKLAAKSHRIVQAGSLSDPMLTESFWPFDGNALQTAGGRAANQLGIMQSVPWPEKLDVKQAIARREVEMARAEVEAVEREVEELVRLACIEVAMADEAIGIC